jgi:hypothetical protein
MVQVPAAVLQCLLLLLVQGLATAALPAGVASLPMYDLPEVRAHTATWWKAVAAQLAHAQLPLTVPQELLAPGDGADYRGAWRSDRLLLSQTCGLPFTTDFRSDLELVATPAYAAPGCGRQRGFRQHGFHNLTSEAVEGGAADEGADAFGCASVLVARAPSEDAACADAASAASGGGGGGVGDALALAVASCADEAGAAEGGGAEGGRESAAAKAPPPLRFRLAADVQGAPRAATAAALGGWLARAVEEQLRRALAGEQQRSGELTAAVLGGERFGHHYDPIVGGGGNVGVHLELAWALSAAACDRDSGAAVAARLRSLRGAMAPSAFVDAVREGVAARAEASGAAQKPLSLSLSLSPPYRPKKGNAQQLAQQAEAARCRRTHAALAAARACLRERAAAERAPPWSVSPAFWDAARAGADRARASAELWSLRHGVVAVNSPDSNSGSNALLATLATLLALPRGAGAPPPRAAPVPFFRRAEVTGSHRASLAAVRRGTADVAAVDPVTLELLRRHAPAELRGLRAIGQTALWPALPYVTRARGGADLAPQLRAALAAAAAQQGDAALDAAREALLLAQGSGTAFGELSAAVYEQRIGALVRAAGAATLGGRGASEDDEARAAAAAPAAGLAAARAVLASAVAPHSAGLRDAAELSGWLALALCQLPPFMPSPRLFLLASLLASVVYALHFALLRCRAGELATHQSLGGRALDDGAALPWGPQLPGDGCSVDGAVASQLLNMARCALAQRVAGAGAAGARRAWEALYCALYPVALLLAAHSVQAAIDLLPVLSTVLLLVATQITAPRPAWLAAEAGCAAEAERNMGTLRRLGLAANVVWLPYCVVVRSWSTLAATVMQCLSNVAAMWSAGGGGSSDSSTTAVAVDVVGAADTATGAARRLKKQQ